MIQTLEVRTAQGDLLSLPLEDVESGFLVLDIDGLDPVKATLSSSTFATMAGAQFQSSRREIRNIVIKLKLEPDYLLQSVRDLRTQLYGFFLPESLVYLRFYDDSGLTVDISGRVEDFTAPLFTDDPQATISIICFDPDFVDLTPIIINGNTVSSSATTIVDYDGTIATGFVFTLNINRSLSEFTLYNETPDGSIRSIDISMSMSAGDVVTISSVFGLKSITLSRSGTNTSVLYAMSNDSDWLSFSKGENNFRAYAIGASIPYSITYNTRYGGL